MDINLQRVRPHPPLLKSLIRCSVHYRPWCHILYTYSSLQDKHVHVHVNLWSREGWGLAAGLTYLLLLQHEVQILVPLPHISHNAVNHPLILGAGFGLQLTSLCA